MSNSLENRAFFTAIAAACVAAWSVNKTYAGKPRQEVPASMLPYAVVTFDPTQQAFHGAGVKNSVKQDYGFKIMGRFPFPTDPTETIELEKNDRANALIAQLQAGSNFASYGFLPLVTEIDYSEPDEPTEAAYEVTLTFTVSALADHH